MKKRERRESQGPQLLAQCRPGDRRRVKAVSMSKVGLISGFGIYPGVEIRVKQDRPAYVIECENTEIALEASLAREITVESLD